MVTQRVGFEVALVVLCSIAFLLPIGGKAATCHGAEELATFGIGTAWAGDASGDREIEGVGRVVVATRNG
jgi:hypothetical protein